MYWIDIVILTKQIKSNIIKFYQRIMCLVIIIYDFESEHISCLFISHYEDMVDDLKLLANELQVIHDTVESIYTASITSPSRTLPSSQLQTLKHFLLMLGTIDSSRGYVKTL